MNREEQVPVKTFAKDMAMERFLGRFNDSLLNLEAALYQESSREESPQVYVVGLPRSGTTLLTQLLPRHLELGYVPNAMAVFHRTPIVGAFYTKKLFGGLPYPGGRLHSTYGRTQGADQPHEFGYFWNRLLRYEDLQLKPPNHLVGLDWDSIRGTLHAVSGVFAAPMVYKPFLLMGHASEWVARLPKSLFLWVDRDLVNCAGSLMGMRRRFLGGEQHWASIRPIEYDSLRDDRPLKQVAGQAFFLNRTISQQVDSLPPKNILKLKYRDICEHPEATINLVKEKLAELGAHVAMRDTPWEYTNYRSSSEITEGEKKEVRAYLKEWSDGC